MILSDERRAALTAKGLRFTVNIEQAMPYLLDRGISGEVAAMFSLGCVPSDEEEFADRLSIPYFTPAGVVGIKYRCTNLSHGNHKETECPKYLYEAGCGTHLYNAQALITASDLVVVTEGELDAICVQAYCAIPAVAYPGVDTWAKQPHYRLCFEGVSEVVVVADGDKAGRPSAARVAQSIGSHARVCDLPDGEDANSYLASRGAGAFIERINS